MKKQVSLTEQKKIMLEILDYIDKVCSKYGIFYSLSGGTLLGAVRHAGFIPWDDDIDIMLTRNNYDKLIHQLEKEPGEYTFFNFSVSGYKYVFAKLCSSVTYQRSPSSEIASLGIFIDIFPIDSLPDRIETLYHFIKENPQYAVVGSRALEVADDKKVGALGTKGEKRVENIVSGDVPIHGSVIMNKKAVQTVGGYQEFTRAEDFALWCELVLHGFRLYVLEDILYKYNVNYADYSKRKLAKRKGEIQARWYYNKKLHVGAAMIKYSIIIPHKNDFTGLQKLLASIPRIKNIQIILVDDHSKMDIQEKILAEFSTDPAIDILQAKGSGAGAARNQGLQQAKGEWLLFADSDDLFIESFVNVLDTYCTTDSELVYFPPLTQNMSKRDYRVRYQQMFVSYFKYRNKEQKWKIRLNFDVPWSKAVKNSFIQKYDFSFETTKKEEDTIFSQSIGIYANKVSISKEPIYMAINKNDSLSHQRSKELFNDTLGVRIRSYLLKSKHFSKRQLKAYDVTYFQLPLRTVMYSFRDFKNVTYTVSVYKTFRSYKIPVFTLRAVVQLLKETLMK
ncbi:hypothetical protein TEHAB4_11650 [Tetragenococcus halophilus]|uniref:LicD family protein n=1 Tax=Tetragenococcus halophilus TaxID=51669 RepID=UPI000CA99DE0|nr:LicD family protein [Tetragenococcus halophilus]GBD80641.1 hypothetical protein TEHD10_1704 [Tetragenococcus halophilus subsp. halophilus]GMG61418.1 hypothetical protein TEHAB4_11650 [Tetragenococcus halophilus]